MKGIIIKVLEKCVNSKLGRVLRPHNPVTNGVLVYIQPQLYIKASGGNQWNRHMFASTDLKMCQLEWKPWVDFIIHMKVAESVVVSEERQSLNVRAGKGNIILLAIKALWRCSRLFVGVGCTEVSVTRPHKSTPCYMYLDNASTLSSQTNNPSKPIT